MHSMESEKCYVYEQPPAHPTKRLNTGGGGLGDSFTLRKNTYQTLWAAREKQIATVAHDANTEVLDRIDDFVSSATSIKFGKKLPTGLILTGYGTTAFRDLFNQISARTASRISCVTILLNRSECPNLKTLLKNVISRITNFPGDEADEEIVSQSIKGPKLLNYDLQIILDWCQTRNIDRIVIGFEDGETFSTAVLTDTVQLFSSWLNRLPFVLLFGVAISIDIFQSRLPQAAVRCMQGESFEVAHANNLLETVFSRIVTDKVLTLHLGPVLSEHLMQQHKDHFQGITAFTAAIKYAYMSHFFANALSVFLNESVKKRDVSKEHFEAIRNLPSFQKHVESLLQHDEFRKVRDLLENDGVLFQNILQMRDTVQIMRVWLLGALRAFQIASNLVLRKHDIPFSSLYTSALSGDLQSGLALRELLLHVKKISSNTLLEILNEILDTLMSMPPSDIDVSPDDFRDVQEELMGLIEASDASLQPLESIHYIEKPTLRTFVIAQKVGISKEGPNISERQSQYSELVERFHDLLSTYLHASIIPLDEYPLHEIFFYDLRSPHRDVFTPKPRFAIERALSTPHDYLGCNCCLNSQEGLCATHPSTAILYELYLESGALINVHDLWSAFNAILGGPNENEQVTMALFYRALGDLKYMGYIKASRRKIDHLVKLAWKGL